MKKIFSNAEEFTWDTFTGGWGKEIKGYIGVYCECGKVCYKKNKPEKRGQLVTIVCPCGNSIQTVYTRD